MAREGYTEARAMLDQAVCELEGRGYASSQSGLGDARYYSRAGESVRIRVATYYHAHDATVDLVITPTDAKTRVSLNRADIIETVDQVIRLAEQMEAEVANNDEDDVITDIN